MDPDFRRNDDREVFKTDTKIRKEKLLYLVVFALCVLVALMAGVLSGISDYKGLMIPNRYSVIIIVSFFLGYAALRAGGYQDDFLSPLLSHIMAAGAVFVLTFVMFAVNVWGAGDSKLALAYSLWTGLAGLQTFIVVMAFTGGLLGIAALLLKKYKPFPNAKEGLWVAKVQQGVNAVPYGIAIVAGAFAAFFDLGYPGVFSAMP